MIVNDFSHYSWTFPLRLKSDTFKTLSHFFAWVSTQFGSTIQAIQCDNGREFDNSSSPTAFSSVCFAPILLLRTARLAYDSYH